MTKSAGTTATKLKRIAQLSGENPGMKFKWLMPHFNRESLIDCFNELDGRKAVGADGVTKEQYQANLESNIDKLIARMKTMSYRPQPVRESLIPKESSGEFRALGISCFEDKIVQRMLAKILNAIYEPIFRDSSYGFRPNRSCHQALKSVSKYLYENKCETVIDVDLKNFFGTINHKILTSALRIKIEDERFIRYVVRFLKAGVLSDGELRMTEEGSPQGNIASPILANVYAHYVIDVWFEDVVKKHIRGTAEMFRYADDIIICCQYSSDAERIKNALGKRLVKYSLNMNQRKTKLVEFSVKKFQEGKKQETFDFLGFTFYIGKSRRGYPIVKLKISKVRLRSKLRKIKEWCKRNRDKMKLTPLWLRFISKIRGLVRYYGVSFNCRYVSGLLDQAVRIFIKWMNRRSQRKSLTFEEFNKFTKKFPLPRVRVYHPLF